MSIFKSVFNGIKEIVGLVGSKADISTIIFKLLSLAEPIVEGVTNFLDGDAKAKIDETVEGIDEFTGLDDGAIDVIHSLPAVHEEAVFDHFKEIIRILAYNKKKVEGYYVE